MDYSSVDVAKYFMHLHALILEVEKEGGLSGAEKKERVEKAFQAMLDDLPQEKVPAWFKKPENIGMLIDLAVALENFVMSKLGAKVMSYFLKLL